MRFVKCFNFNNKRMYLKPMTAKNEGSSIYIFFKYIFTALCCQRDDITSQVKKVFIFYFYFNN